MVKILSVLIMLVLSGCGEAPPFEKFSHEEGKGKGVFFTDFEKFPKFETLCRILSEDLLAKQQFDFDEFKTSSPEQRYLNLLERRPDLIQRVPQHQLASFLGIKPQSLSRLKSRILQKSKN